MVFPSFNQGGFEPISGLLCWCVLLTQEPEPLFPHANCSMGDLQDPKMEVR